MKKRMITSLLALFMVVGAFAQFEKGKTYVGASLSNFEMKYTGLDKMSMNLNAQVGHMFMDNLLGYVMMGYENPGDDLPTGCILGGGGRYHILQNGIFLGANAKYKHANQYDDFLVGMEVGYSFFIGRKVTIEPTLYYDQSFKQHSDYSTIGLKVGIGIYL